MKMKKKHRERGREKEEKRIVVIMYTIEIRDMYTQSKETTKPKLRQLYFNCLSVGLLFKQ